MAVQKAKDGYYHWLCQMSVNKESLEMYLLMGVAGGGRFPQRFCKTWEFFSPAPDYIMWTSTYSEAF